MDTTHTKHTHKQNLHVTQERSLLWSIPRLGLVSASIVSEGDAKQKTGEKIVGRVELEQDQYTSCLEVVLDRG